jgi:hypothetical protein
MAAPSPPASPKAADFAPRAEFAHAASGQRPPAPFKPDPDSLPPDYLALISVMLALCAVYFRAWLFSWLALGCIAASVLTRKSEDFDKLNTAVSVLVVLASLAFSHLHLGPPTD